MSVEAVQWALSQVTTEPVDKLILIALADYADHNHMAFPGRRRLAEVGMCSVDTVDRAIKRLEEIGLVTKERRVSERGGHTSNCYKLAVAPKPQIAATPSAPKPKTEPHDAARVAAPREGGEPHHAPTLAASRRGEGSRIRCGHRNPSLEPSIEPNTPLPPKGGADGPWYWHEQLNPQPTAGVRLADDGTVSLVNGTAAYWLAQFGNDQARLDLALIEVAGTIRKNSTVLPEVQVARGLARIAGEKRDRDQRYEAAAKVSKTRGGPGATPRKWTWNEQTQRVEAV